MNKNAGFLARLFRILIQLYTGLYVLVHVVLWSVPETVNYLVFQNYHGNLSNPKEFGLNNVHNFYLQTDTDLKIGVWHFLPPELNYEDSSHDHKDLDKHFSNYLKHTQKPLIIHAHGMDGSRGDTNRRLKCVKLAEMGYHVFALDYRGYGDSDSYGRPTEKGVVTDLIKLYNFAKSYQNKANIFLWGHSLGTGIVSHAAKALKESGDTPSGVILEAPFLNISHAATEFVAASLFYNNWWIIDVGNNALKQMDLHFRTDKHIAEINTKVLIMHAEDDWLIDWRRSQQLYDLAKITRPQTYPPIDLKIFGKEHQLGHSNIYLHDEFNDIITKFIQ